jgi:hypothetical protein
LALLDVVHDAVATGKCVLQLLLNQRQLIAFVGDQIEECLRCTEPQFVTLERVLVREDVLDRALGGTTAVVADSVKAMI